jgi:hypothetical protein
MRRPGFEPGFWAWKAQVIAARPSTRNVTHLEVFVTYNVFAPEFRQQSFASRVQLRDHKKSKIFWELRCNRNSTKSFSLALLVKRLTNEI